MIAIREIDLLVIEKVMGWKYDPARTFSPSTNLFHAWEMEECVLRDSTLLKPYGDALVKRIFGGSLEGHEPAQVAVALSHASPHQRCLAALEAVGAEQAVSA